MPQILKCIVCLIATSCVCSELSAADWPQWLGPTRNNVSPERVTPWTNPPAVLWKQRVGNGFSSPVVASGVVYIHELGSDDKTETVSAFDLHSGALKWRQNYARSLYRSQLGSGPRATASVVDHKLIVMGITGELVAFNAGTGEIVWNVNPYEDHNVAMPTFGVCSSPLVAEQRIVLPVGGAGMAIAAYELDTGKLAWKALDEPAATASPIVWQRNRGADKVTEFVVQTTLRVAGLNPADGAVLWEHPLVFQPSGVAPTPLICGEQLLCTTQDTGTMAIAAPNSAGQHTAASWWNDKLSSYFSTGGVAADDRVILVTNAVMPLPQADLRCLAAKTGEELWKQDRLGYFHVGLIVTADEKLLILDDSGNLLLASAGRDGYKELSRAKVCGGTFCNPALSDGHVVVRDGQEVVCLRLESP